MGQWSGGLCQRRMGLTVGNAYYDVFGGGANVTIRPEVLIDGVTLIVSDLDRAEDDYVRTFGCSVEKRADIEPALTRVLCMRDSRGRRSSLRLGHERIDLLEFA